jgi:hypothetical protein
VVIARRIQIIKKDKGNLAKVMKVNKNHNKVKDRVKVNRKKVKVSLVKDHVKGKKNALVLEMKDVRNVVGWTIINIGLKGLEVFPI